MTMTTVRVKICGITRIEDAMAAVDAGADALGFIFYDKSPRSIAPADAAAIIATLPPFVQAVGLFVNEEIQTIRGIVETCGIDVVQLHGDEPPEFCASLPYRIVKSIRVRNLTSLDPMKDYRVSAFVLDAYSKEAYGGTGLRFNWDIAVSARRYGTVILAGGLTPENVAQGIEQVHPYAVDVAGGVEVSPGIKDHAKMREFIRRAKNCR